MLTRFKSWGIVWYLIIFATALPFYKKKMNVDERIELYLLILPLTYYFLVITPMYMFYLTKFIPSRLFSLRMALISNGCTSMLCRFCFFLLLYEYAASFSSRADLK